MRLVCRAFILALSLGTAVATLVGTDAAHAATPTADEVVRKSAEARSPQSSVQKMTLEFTRKGATTRSMTLSAQSKRRAQGGVMSLVRFLAPVDMAGVAFLAVPGAGEGGDDLRQLWSPGTGQEEPTTITGGNKSGAFAGTDITYEDLSVGDPNTATHVLVRTETLTVGGSARTCYVIESTPKPEAKSAYSKLTTWIDTVDSMPRQVFFFNKKGEHWKKMVVEKVHVEGANSVPMLTTVEDLKRGSRTVIRVETVRLNVPPAELPDTVFSVEGMKAAP
jgi:hypothetical protein